MTIFFLHKLRPIPPAFYYFLIIAHKGTIVNKRVRVGEKRLTNPQFIFVQNIAFIIPKIFIANPCTHEPPLNPEEWFLLFLKDTTAQNVRYL